MLTLQQASLLAFIRRYQAVHEGASPSFTEMMGAVGVTSKSAVHRLLAGLEDRKQIIRTKYKSRAIRILQEK